jgi:hypothetical protein
MSSTKRGVGGEQDCEINSSSSFSLWWVEKDREGRNDVAGKEGLLRLLALETLTRVLNRTRILAPTRIIL